MAFRSVPPVCIRSNQGYITVVEWKRKKEKGKRVRKKREMLSTHNRQEYECSLPDLNAETCPNTKNTLVTITMQG